MGLLFLETLSVAVHALVFTLALVTFSSKEHFEIERTDLAVISYLLFFLLCCDLGYAIPYDWLVYLLHSEGPSETLEMLVLFFLSGFLFLSGIFFRRKSPIIRTVLILGGLYFFWFFLLEINFGEEWAFLGPPGPIRHAFMSARPKSGSSPSLLGNLIAGFSGIFIKIFMSFTVTIILLPSMGLGGSWRLREVYNEARLHYRGKRGAAFLLSRLTVLHYMRAGSSLLPATASHLDNEINQLAFLSFACVYIFGILTPSLISNRQETSIACSRRCEKRMKIAVGLWAVVYLSHVLAPVAFGVPIRFIKDANSASECSAGVQVHSLKAYRVGPWLALRGMVNSSEGDRDRWLRRLSFSVSLPEESDYRSIGKIDVYSGTEQHPQFIGDEGQYLSKIFQLPFRPAELALKVSECEPLELKTEK